MICCTNQCGTMGTSVIGGNLLRMKLNFVFIRFLDWKLDISLELNEGSEKFLKGSN